MTSPHLTFIPRHQRSHGMTKAIELASYLDEYHQGYEDEGTSIFTRAAAELRRLAAVEQELADLKAAMGEPVAWRYKAVAIVDGEWVPVKEVDPNRCEFEITQSAPHDHSHMSYPLDYPKLEDYSPLCSVSTSPCKFTCVGVIDSNGDIYPEPPDAGTELYAKAKP